MINGQTETTNRQNDQFWALKRTEEVLETRYQGKRKIMCWMGVVKQSFNGPYWFEYESGRSVSVNQDRYLDVMENGVLLVLRDRRDFGRLWFIQDGATPHCTERVLDWLKQQFCSRLISRKGSVWWPPQSPGLSPHRLLTLGLYSIKCLPWAATVS